MVYSTFLIIKSANIRYVFAISLSAIYIVHLFNFINLYFFRNPIYNAEAFNLSSRVLSSYITRADNYGKKVIVISNFSKMRFYHYLFDTNNYDANSAKKIKSLINQKIFKINNVEFIQCLEDFTIFPDIIYVVDLITDCKPKNDISSVPLYITQINDGAQLYKIYNDNFCMKHTLDKYPSNFSLNDFKVEDLSEKRFCEKFVVDPSL